MVGHLQRVLQFALPIRRRSFNLVNLAEPDPAGGRCGPYRGLNAREGSQAVQNPDCLEHGV